MTPMKTEYGIAVPRGVQKDWEANSMGCEGAGNVLRRYHTPNEWGDPTNCVAWFDRFERLRVIVGHYANSRSVTVRIDANGKWTATFGRAAIADRNAERQDHEDGLGPKDESDGAGTAIARRISHD